MKETFKIQSSDGIHDLHVTHYKPDGKVKAVLQIVHGMCEYIDRYDEFAMYLNEHGIAVLGLDHLGHGHSVNSDDELGFFGEKGGKGFLIKDQFYLTRQIKRLYPGKKVFMLGHSMGSFITRRYITIWGGELDGVIVMGTGQQPFAKVKAGRMLAYTIMHSKGLMYRSELLYKLSTGGYEDAFKKRGLGSWLSKNDDINASYEADKYCNFIFTASGFHTLFSIVEDLSLKKNDNRIPTELPILFMSGMDDPVGDYTKGVLAVYNEYRKLGIKDLDVIFYQNDRHEILNELDREDVYRDVLAFLENHI